MDVYEFSCHETDLATGNLIEVKWVQYILETLTGGLGITSDVKAVLSVTYLLKGEIGCNTQSR